MTSLDRRSSTCAVTRARRPHPGRAWVAAALALAVGAGACRSKAATSPGDLLGISGTFTLTAVNALPLPYQDGSTYVVRGALVIHNTPRYDLTETDSTAGAATDVKSSGQWTISNNAFTFLDDNGTLYLGALAGSGDTVHVQFGTHLGTYVKQ